MRKHRGMQTLNMPESNAKHTRRLDPRVDVIDRRRRRKQGLKRGDQALFLDLPRAHPTSREQGYSWRIPDNNAENVDHTHMVRDMLRSS